VRCANLGGAGHVRQVVLSPEISWAHLDWLRAATTLPIRLKGALETVAQPDIFAATLTFGSTVVT
jgi:hypothetical protein